PAVARLSGWRLVLEKVPLLALTIGSSIVTLVMQQRGGVVGSLDTFPLHVRVQNALVSYVAYIGKMLCSVRLSAFYPYQVLSAWWVAVAVVALIAVSAVVIVASRRDAYLPVGWFWYLGTLVPVIGLVQVGNQAMADRYTYIPLIGPF